VNNEDKDNSEIKNPNTGDFITTFIIFGSVLLISVTLIIKKSKFKKFNSI